MSESEVRQIGYSELKKYLRHRFPMQLIDRVTDYKPGKSITAIVAASGVSDWAQGHFPGRAIYPGTHLLQAFSQTSIVLLQLSTAVLRDDEVTVVGSIKARFTKIVVPGDVITFKNELKKTVQNLFLFSGAAFVNESKVGLFQVNIARVLQTDLGGELW